jgi:hypothetical protein
MTVDELLKLIESEGGHLSLLPSGDLEWHRVSPELLAQVTVLKAGIVAALQERDKPKPWTGLIALPDLIAANERYREEQAAERVAEFARRKAAREQSQFVYQSRPPEEWESHANQRSEKARILLEVVRDFPDATVAELAEAAEMSVSWVRRTLKRAGITIARASRRKETQP